MALPRSHYLDRPTLSAAKRVVALRLKASAARENGDPREAFRLSGLAGRLEIAALLRPAAPAPKTEAAA